jgi:hypothetical protein
MSTSVPGMLGVNQTRIFLVPRSPTPKRAYYARLVANRKRRAFEEGCSVNLRRAGMWAMAAVGLVGVTYGLSRMRGRNQGAMGAIMNAAPMALGGLLRRTMSKVPFARR